MRPVSLASPERSLSPASRLPQGEGGAFKTTDWRASDVRIDRFQRTGMGQCAVEGALDDPADIGRGLCGRAVHRVGGGLPQAWRTETDRGADARLHHVVPGCSGVVADPLAVLRRFHVAQLADGPARL